MTATDQFEAALAALRTGDLIGLPTETVYGLGADASNPAAVRKVFAAKGRPSTHPLIVHLGGADAVPQWAAEFPATARALAARFWPGPLTLVLPKASGVPPEVTGGQDTVALRVPGHPLALRLLQAFGGGVAAPSANRYGRVSPTTAEHVREELGDAVAVVLDGGNCEVGLESTIVGCLDGRVILLRPGRITRDEIEQVVGAVASGGVDAPRVPGSVKSHYAPRTPVELVEPTALANRVEECNRAGQEVVVLARSQPTAAGSAAAWIVAAADPAGYARGLYASLRRLDRHGAARILVELPPTGQLWAAVHDRLARSAARADVADVPGAVPDADAP